MFNRLAFAILLAPSVVSLRKWSKYKSESEERLREFRDKCSVRDTDVFTRSQLKSQNCRYLWNQTSYKKSTHTKLNLSSSRFIFRPQTTIKWSRTCRKRPRNMPKTASDCVKCDTKVTAVI